MTVSRIRALCSSCAFSAGEGRPLGDRLRLVQLHARDVGQLGQGLPHVLGELLDVPEQVVVADQAEVHPAVVAHQRDPDALVADQRDHGEGVDHLPAHQVQRELRSRHVGNDHVEEALTRH
jgi:hypothetical protein